jgi:hypothetical protein
MANIDAGFEYVKPRSTSSWTLVAVFTLSIFLSAVLLFSVQPMFSKLALPLLGGSSNVWNTAMVFFQGALLCGYIYAHVISKYLKLATQIIVHGLVLGLGCFFLPIAIAEGWTPPESGAQAFWLIALFTASVGAPFFAISANAPLLQRWFSRTDNKDAQDPYFLYAASNAGSLLSLCLYPVLFEPLLRVREQTSLWTAGYVLLIAIILGAGLIARRHQRSDIKAVAAEISKPSILTLKQRLIWIGLAFIPSSLMLGVTSHITNNIASAPFLWIMPLGLYLLTFIIAFAKTPLVSSQQLKYIMPIAVVGALWFGILLKGMTLLSIVVSLASYFVIALACHVKLVEKRPDAHHLTEFYIWMSFGGVLGGIFNALLAPMIFNAVYEYLIVLCLAFCIGFIFDKPFESREKIRFTLVKYLGLSALGLCLLLLLKVNLSVSMFCAGVYLSYGLAKLSETKTLSMAFNIMLAATLAVVIPVMARKNILTDRSFFGILHVKASEGEYGVVHRFMHGDSIHNYQLQRDDLKKIPLAYYSIDNSFDKGLTFARSQSDSNDFSVAMVGLGAGAMACYERPQDNWVYFEIDPAVVSMATNPNYFSFMELCSIKSDIRLGDARLKLKDIAKKSQDYIIVDAFSSNSIPAHLVTREALELYRSRLKDNGLIFFHTSNRSLDISSVVASLASDAGLASRYIQSNSFEGKPYAKYQSSSTAVMIGSEEQMKNASAFDPDWQQIIPSPDVGVWSDDYSHVIGTIKAHYKNNKKIIAADNR